MRVLSGGSFDGRKIEVLRSGERSHLRRVVLVMSSYIEANLAITRSKFTIKLKKFMLKFENISTSLILAAVLSSIQYGKFNSKI